MKITKLVINNFKSFFGKHEIYFSDNITFLLGFNGSGKSNFLEAIFFLNFDDLKKCNSFINSDLVKNDDKLFLSVEVNIDYSNDNTVILDLISSYFTDLIISIFKKKDKSKHFDLINIEELSSFLKKFVLENVSKDIFDYSKVKLEKKVSNKTIINNIYIPIMNSINIKEKIMNKLKSKSFELISFWNKKKFGEFEIFFDFDFFESNITKFPNNYLEENIDEKSFFIKDYHKKISDNIKSLLLSSFEDFFTNYFEIIDTSFCINLKSFENLLNIIFWKYSEEMIIPESFSINENTKCFPTTLKNIFYLVGKTIEDVKKDWKNLNSREKLITDLNNKTNELLKKSWKDFCLNDYSINFIAEGNKILTRIKNYGLHNNKIISNFSDGYKQFLSILFSIGLSRLNNSIILLDEPEIHLHPSSIISLRKIFLDISEKNNLSHFFISTHSVNMIDKYNLDLYYILEIRKYKTEQNFDYISSSVYQNTKNEKMPAIIKQSMGVDFFSDFFYKKYCILVEGVIDKKILEKIFNDKKIDCSVLISYGNQADSFFDSIKENFGNYFFQKSVFILLDSDKSGKDAKKRYVEVHKFYNNHIFLLNELLNIDEKKEIEIEFFYKDCEYDEFTKMKLLKENKGSKSRIKEIKKLFLDRNINNLDNEKINIFIDNITKKFGNNDD